MAGPRSEAWRVDRARRHPRGSALERRDARGTGPAQSDAASGNWRVRGRGRNRKSKMTPHKSGFVSILGRPNAGKSTLLNALVGQKVAIVADKPQTTRTAIQGVLTTSAAQIVFVDTPGIHKSDSAINKRMMDAVRASLEERDLFIYIVDVTKPFGSGDEKALSILRREGPPVIVVLNKI